MCINAEKIKNILSEKISEETLENFRVDNFSGIPGEKGCICVNKKWYVYDIDDHANPVFTGPFEGNAIIYASAVIMHQGKLFPEYKFSEDEMRTFTRSHYGSLKELG